MERTSAKFAFVLFDHILSAVVSSGCTDTAVTTLTVSAVVEGCPKLQMLDLSCTGPVSRDCLFRLAFSLQSLTRLKLSHTA